MGKKQDNSAPGMLRRAFKYRCYPNKGTRRRAYRKMRVLAGLWNACVEERNDARKACRAKLDRLVFLEEALLSRELTEKERKALRQTANKSVQWPSAYGQYALMRKREHPEYADCDAQMCQDVLTKVDGSDKSFLALWKKGDKAARPPRFKGMHRCLTYRQSGWRLDGNNLHLSHVGVFHIRLHRPIVGKIKTVSVTEKNGKWYACFSCELPDCQGACGPVSALKSGVLPDLQQKYTPAGGNDPETGGTHNSTLPALIASAVGMTRKRVELTTYRERLPLSAKVGATRKRSR